jgi:hypothetical protein
MEVSRFVRMLGFLVVVFMACAVVHADSNDLILKQLTDNDTDDIKPQVSGAYAVWQGQDPNAGDWEIYFYDGNDVVRLTDNNSDDVNPQIDGPTAVWEGWDSNGSDWEIFFFDGSAVHQLSDNDYNDISPQLSDALVVWQCWDANDWEICSATIPVPVEFKFTPQSLNLRSRGRWVTCLLWLPEGYTGADIDTSSLLLLDAVSPVRVQASRRSTRVVMKFDRFAVQALLAPGPAVEVTLTGQLTDGTPISGSDTIKVIP